MGRIRAPSYDKLLRRVYPEQQPRCIHCTIVWKISLNGNPKLDDTKQGLVLAPSSYWEIFLMPKLEKLVAEKRMLNLSVYLWNRR